MVVVIIINSIQMAMIYEGSPEGYENVLNAIN